MDWVAIGIACLSLLVAAMSLGWQVAAWALEGPRVKVQLREGVLGRGGAASAAVLRNSSPRDLSDMRREGFDGEDLIGIRVTNVGRAKVKIERYGVQLRRGGMSLEFTEPHSYSSPLPHWLEPGESGSWFLPMQDARALVYATRGIDATAFGVRAFVELGDGRQRLTSAHLDVPVADVA